jgi:hypothetical protein
MTELRRTLDVVILHPMKRMLRILFSISLAFCNLSTDSAFAQTTSFTYQGRLNDHGGSANGSYDLIFTLYDSTNDPGNILAGPLTNSATLVSNGLFATTLDFGGTPFNGGSCWLEIRVCTNGNGGFTALIPRQQVTSSPYAIFANRAATATVAGSAPPVAGSPAYIQNQNTSPQAANCWISGTAKAGSFAGDGSGLTGIPPAASSAPASPTPGQLYFDTTLNKLRYYDGASWQTIVPNGARVYRATSGSLSYCQGGFLSAPYNGNVRPASITVWYSFNGTDWLNGSGTTNFAINVSSDLNNVTVTNVTTACLRMEVDVVY